MKFMILIITFASLSGLKFEKDKAPAIKSEQKNANIRPIFWNPTKASRCSRLCFKAEVVEIGIDLDSLAKLKITGSHPRKF